MVKKLHSVLTCIILGGLNEKNITLPLKLLNPLLHFIFALCTIHLIINAQLVVMVKIALHMCGKKMLFFLHGDVG
jgi:hypothetical protein